VPFKSLLLSIASLALILTAPRPAHAQSPDDSRVPAGEPELWQRIAALQPLPPSTQLHENWFEAARERRRALLASVRLYLTLYPGGAHRDEAIRLELRSLFELGTLPGGTLAPLAERVEEILRAPPSAVALHEAAYWAMLQRRWREAPATTQSTTAPLATDVDTFNSYREYVEKYSQSRYTPRLAALLFAEAAGRDDRAAMQRILTGLTESFPRHAVTERLAGEWRRTALVGEPFWPAVTALPGCALDPQAYRGFPVLIVFWSAYDEPSRRCVLDIERFRAEHPELRVVGVSLDEDVDHTAAASRELGLDWLQCNDRLGWGGALVRFWGIDCIPYILVISRAGRLAGSAGADGWETLARRELTAGAN
jgi:hypothetical protein